MVCIYCSASTQVANSRLQRRSNHIWRRRKCLSCGAIFTTEEHAALQASLMVRLPTVQLVPFSRDHLFTSIHDSCRHRSSSISDATALTQTIISELMGLQRSGIIARPDINRAAHNVLARFDATAAAVYAAYHPMPAPEPEVATS